MLTNWIRSSFIATAAFTAIVGLLVNYVEPYLPLALTRSYRYGKFSVNAYQPIVAKTEVPKEWFKHFYIFAAPTSSYILYLVLNKYLLNGNISETVMCILNTTFGANRQALVSPENTFLATLLLSLHCWKRLYETQYINIFSNKRMNIIHYAVGFHHYIGTLLCLIGESKGFVEGSVANFSWQRITYFHFGCALIFITASYTQFHANCILSDLRKDKGGKVNSAVYKIPHGGLFEYVTGALQTTEITIYIIMSVILWQASTFHYITLWVLSNQIATAVFSHKWYTETFQNYPKSRKILIPHFF